MGPPSVSVELVCVVVDPVGGCVPVLVEEVIWEVESAPAIMFDGCTVETVV